MAIQSSQRFTRPGKATVLDVSVNDLLVNRGWSPVTMPHLVVDGCVITDCHGYHPHNEECL